MALSEPTKSFVWLRRVLSELGIEKQLHYFMIMMATWYGRLTGQPDTTTNKTNRREILPRYAISCIKMYKLIGVRTYEMKADFLTKALLPRDMSRAVSAAQYFNGA